MILQQNICCCKLKGSWSQQVFRWRGTFSYVPLQSESRDVLRNSIVLYLWLNTFDRIYFASNLLVACIKQFLPQLFSAVSTGDLSKYNVATADLQLFWKLAVSQTFFIDLTIAQMMVLWIISWKKLFLNYQNI